MDAILSLLQAHAFDIGGGVACFFGGWLERHLKVGSRAASVLTSAVDVFRGALSRKTEPAPNLSPEDLEALKDFAQLLKSTKGTVPPAATRDNLRPSAVPGLPASPLAGMPSEPSSEAKA